jgi:hypothetical protein
VARFAGGSSSRPEAQYLGGGPELRTHRTGQRLSGAIVVALLVIVMWSSLSLAQTPQPMPPGPPANPARPLLTPVDQADENWSFLRDPANRTDFWDPLKYIPLNRDGNYFLTFWFENRSEYEWFQNAAWGQIPQTISGYWLQRVIPALGLTLLNPALNSDKSPDIC